MITKKNIVHSILKDKTMAPVCKEAKAFAPTNIALCKYWGKRNNELNLPVTSSLSVGLKDKGAQVIFSAAESNHHTVALNNNPVSEDSSFYKKLVDFLSLFPFKDSLNINITSNIPIAAGLASSACGFASVVKGLNHYYGWELSSNSLSILARLGSGSACRSLWDGFVLWQEGQEEDGSDSHGIPLDNTWPTLRLGLLMISSEEKSISSRDGMEKTRLTSPFYDAWPGKVHADLAELRRAIAARDFNLLGKTAESNALCMHATMLSAWDPICYWQEETLTNMKKVWQLRKESLPLYFTQDAGPNLKLLFEASAENTVIKNFPEMEIIKPFE